MSHEEFVAGVIKLWKQNPYPSALQNNSSWGGWIRDIARTKKNQIDLRILSTPKLLNEFIGICKEILYSDDRPHFKRLLDGLDVETKLGVLKIKDAADEEDCALLAAEASGGYCHSVKDVERESREKTESPKSTGSTTPPLGTATSGYNFYGKESGKFNYGGEKGKNDEDLTEMYRPIQYETIGSKLSRKRSRKDVSESTTFDIGNKKPKSSKSPFLPLPVTRRVLNMNKETTRVPDIQNELVSPEIEKQLEVKNTNYEAVNRKLDVVWSEDDIFENSCISDPAGEDALNNVDTSPLFPAGGAQEREAASCASIRKHVSNLQLSPVNVRKMSLLNGRVGQETPKLKDRKIKGIRSATALSSSAQYPTTPTRQTTVKPVPDFEISTFLENEDENLSMEQDKENFPESIADIVVKYPKPPNAPELTLEIFEELKNMLEKHADEKVVSGFAMFLLQKELAILYDEKEWLIDKNIDFYLEMIRARSKTKGYPSVYVFPSVFYPLLCLPNRNYTVVQDATGDDDIFSYDMVVFPINLHHHWRLVVMRFKRRILECYDSMKHDNMEILKTIAKYVREEFHYKHIPKVRKEHMNSAPGADGTMSKTDFKLEDWKIRNVPSDAIPQQQNAIDCGVFILQYAEYLSRKKKFDFDQSHIPYFRKRMTYEVMIQRILTCLVDEPVRKPTTEINEQA